LKYSLPVLALLFFHAPSLARAVDSPGSFTPLDHRSSSATWVNDSFGVHESSNVAPGNTVELSASTEPAKALPPLKQSSIFRGISVSPLIRFSALGGQYFTTSVNSTGANVDLSIIPAIGLSPTLSLTPILIGSYHETQSPYNFQGQNVLIQRQVDHLEVLYLTWAVSPQWKLKPRAGYKQELVKQDIDDSLSSGLFNYNRSFAGASVERDFNHGSLEVAYEFSRDIYPNYQALTSDPRLAATGITSEAGTNVLNFNAYDTSLDYEFSPAGSTWHFSYNFHWIRQKFTDQNVVQDLGAIENRGRIDDVLELSTQQTFTFKRWGRYWNPTLAETFQYYISNQNAFDANQLFFTPSYYDFVDIQLNPSVTTPLIPGRLEVTWLAGLGFRQYTHRQTQDPSGAYLGDLIHSWNRSLGGIVKYRITKSLYAILVRNIVTYSSNTQFEQNYPYNYTVFDILGGLTWEYGY
jgi:hypothetical protein